MSSNALITGGAGFIGSHLCEKLLRKGKKVFVLDNLSTGRIENIAHLMENKNFVFKKGSVLDKGLVGEMADTADEIYHLAAAVGVKTIMDNPLESWILNIEGTENVLNAACKQKTPVLIASTSEIYGKNTKIPFGEDDDRVYGSVKNYRWGYAFSKGVDEFLALAYFREKGLPARIVRFFNTIGPRQTGVYGMVVPRFIGQAMRGEDITVYGDGNQTRCFGYVKDIVGAVTELMEREDTAGEVYNLGSDEEVSINELAEKVVRLTKSSSKIIHVPYRDVYPRGFEDMERRKPDLSKIKKLMGYEPTLDLEGIIKDIMRSFGSK